MRIIPAIDIIDGKCIRLEKGDFSTKKIYNENPLEVAKEFEDNGIQYLHLVDLDGAKKRRIINWNILEQIAVKTKLKIDFGGGVQSENDLKIAFESGAEKITAGSIAVKNHEMVIDWIKKYGSDKIILGADVKNKKITIHGWKERTDINIFSFIKNYSKTGIQEIICTDISKDGMLAGSSNELYNEIKEKFPELFLIASGGISEISDIKKLNDLEIDGVIIGKAIYENRIDLKELKDFLC
ncbi:MAG: 1-(5-phosphoribosyl)-5-[(5-phosphoribosylamino)methylideneamino]imidazole-4-carboxamide isomerase [Candidatus Marinimicrobia bacterium]|nr:1-(5-phosphoribosyl)-5-[(5-phosphoribosylamino)methylideneamino]imidazole-4-carboxamide isomerase [Candidatus Neomarinimicrobiota bacterium]